MSKGADESEHESLLRSLVAVRRMARAALEPIRVTSVDAEGASRVSSAFAEFFVRACEDLRVEGLELTEADPKSLDSFEQIVDAQLGLSQGAGRVERTDGLSQAITRVDAASAQALYGAGTIESPDGARLEAFASGPEEAEPVVLIQALGMPIELADGLLGHIGERARVVTWEVRGSFRLDEDFDAYEKDLNTEVADLLLVMDHFGIQRAHLLAFCIGAPLAMRAAAQHPERFASLCVVNGGFGLADARSDYEQQFHSVFPKVGQSRSAAKLFYQLFRGGGGRGSGAGSGIAVDEPSAHIIYLPYVHPEGLYRYGCLVTPLLQSDVLAWTDELRTPTMIVAIDEDPVSDLRAAQIVSERIAGCELVVLPGDRHLGLMDQPERLSACWLPFLRGHATR